jgi:DNA-binding XRE family transcriptional regulator
MPKQNTKPADYPQAVLLQIELLAQNIVIARKRRKETQAQWAKKLGVSQPTMARVERGDPSVAMASYVMCMWLVNQATGLPDLISPLNDHASLELEVAKIRSRSSSAAPISSSKRSAPSRGGAISGNHANTAAGLAALMSKAGPKP